MSLWLLILIGCVGAPPEEDFVLSYTSMESAKQAQAPRYAPGLYTQAEDFYRKALADYKDRRYESAKNNFVRARNFAEKAENYTVLKKAESGEAP